MKRFVLTSLFSLALASTGVAGDLSFADRAALAALPASDVASLRAGASQDVPPVAAAERIALSRAAASATDLDQLRAGDDHDLAVIAVVLGIVVLAILVV
jgi:hypothetical protein